MPAARDASVTNPMRNLLTVVSVAVAATSVFFHRLLITDGIFSARDIQRVYYPLKQYWASRVSAGELPEWYPYDGMGQSYVGMVISGALHPFNVLYLLFSLETALTMSALLSFVAAFAGTFALARRFSASLAPALLAGVLFTFNGYLVGITNNLLYLMGAATVPWALWAIDRLLETPSLGRTGPAAALLTMILLTGDSQSFVICCALTFVIAPIRYRGRHQLAAAGGVLALAALLSAPQTLPALSALPLSMTAHQPMAAVLTWSMHPLRLVELALGPIFRGEQTLPIAGELSRRLLDNDADQLWVESMYFGLPGLLLAACGLIALRRQRRLWGALAASGLLLGLALGKHAGLYRLAHDWAPLWKNFRYPEKLMPFTMLALSLLAAAGWAAVERDPLWQRRFGIAAAAAGALFLTAGLLLPRSFAGLTLPALQQLSLESMNAGAHSAAVAAVLALLFLGVRRPSARAVLVLLVTFFGLMVANEPTYALSSREILRTVPALVAEIEQRVGPARPGAARVFGASNAYAVPKLPTVSYRDAYAAAVATSLEAVTPSLFGLEGGNAYLPAASLRARQLADLAASHPEAARALGVGYVAYSTALTPLSPWQADAEVGAAALFKLHLVAIPELRPRAFLASKRCVASPSDALAAILADERDAIMECDAAAQAPRLGAPGRATLVSWSPERVELTADLTRPAMLVLTDAAAPGWEATVDGSPARIEVANYAARAVELPGGSHRAVFTYRTPGLRLGTALACAGILAWLALTLIGRRADRNFLTPRAPPP